MAAAPDLPPALHAAAAAAAAACWGVWGGWRRRRRGGGADGLAGELANPNATPAALQAAAVGRGGAVRQRKSEGEPGGGRGRRRRRRRPRRRPPPPSPGADESDGSTTAAAATAPDAARRRRDEAAPASRRRGRGRGGGRRGARRARRAAAAAAPRLEAVPAAEEGRAREGRRELLAPGGFWWQDTRMPMPPGRQPGELAVDPSGGRGAPAAHPRATRCSFGAEPLSRGSSRAPRRRRPPGAPGVGHRAVPPTEPGEHPSPSTNVAVDDSVIARQSTFKQPRRGEASAATSKLRTPRRRPTPRPRPPTPRSRSGAAAAEAPGGDGRPPAARRPHATAAPPRGCVRGVHPPGR